VSSRQPRSRHTSDLNGEIAGQSICRLLAQADMPNSFSHVRAWGMDIRIVLSASLNRPNNDSPESARAPPTRQKPR
jgi:hypothetical protein